MRKFMTLYLITLTAFVIILVNVITHYQTKIIDLGETNEEYVSALNEEHDKEILNLKTYEYLYTENSTDLKQTEISLNQLKEEYTTFKDKVAYVKINPQYSRGATEDLTKFDAITEDDLNAWIKKKAPSNSPFIGKADTFIEASKETGLDPKYIVAHAALESSWGTSNIAKNKNNYFGIAAYNASPTSSAYSYDSMDDGIISGAKWIYNNYINKGQNTLEKMIYGDKAYCQSSNGSPDPKWIYQIERIMST